MTDARVQALNAAHFAFAIQAKLGIPSDVPPSKLPSIVSLQPGQSSVQYALTFSEFNAAALPREQDPVTWFYQSQGDATCWSFSGPVSLNLQSASFDSLPAAGTLTLSGGAVTAGNLSVLPVPAPDSFGAPRLLHAASSISGATTDTWPTWSPDGK